MKEENEVRIPISNQAENVITNVGEITLKTEITVLKGSTKKIV